jgi:hypothetical protein
MNSREISVRIFTSAFPLASIRRFFRLSITTSWDLSENGIIKIKSKEKKDRRMMFFPFGIYANI